MSIGIVLKQRRIELNIKQDDLAERLGVTVQSVSKWERGINEPKASRVSQLAKELKLTEKEICSGQATSKSEIDVLDFISFIDKSMHSIPTTQFLVELYHHLDDKVEFIESIRSLAGQSSISDEIKDDAKAWLERADSGAITFDSEEEKKRFYAQFQKILQQ